jgi:hypothetical protein
MVRSDVPHVPSEVWSLCRVLTVFSSILLPFASHLLARLLDRLRDGVSKDGLDFFERFVLRFRIEAVAS